MRNEKQIAEIQKQFSDPYVIDDFLSGDDIQHLVDIFNLAKNKIHKNTGPVTLDIKPYILDPVVLKILERIKLEIGPYEITTGFFFQTSYPHVIHNDDLFQLPDKIYKAISIPLTFNVSRPLINFPKLCFFDQFYFHGPAKFFKGNKELPTYYNKQIYDYRDVDGLTTAQLISQDTYRELFTHMDPKWLEGLSLHSTIDCIPGTAMVFDSVRLHCSNDFRKLGIESKLAISIFTRKLDCDNGSSFNFYQNS